MPIVLLIVVIAIVIAGIPLWLSWLWGQVFAPNTTLALFGTPELSYWKALGLILLCMLLFGSKSIKVGGK